MIEAVLFDYGNVLSAPADPVAWARMLEVSSLDEERFASAYWAPRHEYDRGTHTGAEYWIAAGRSVGAEFNRDQLAALLALDITLWTSANQPMIDWASRLQAAGTRTGILSNLGDEMTAGVMARMPWLQHFDHRTFSHTLKIAKPELEIYLHAAEGLKTRPENILFVDDRDDNCAAGFAAGMQVIRYGDHAAFLREMELRGWDLLWRLGTMRPSSQQPFRAR